LRLLDGIRPGAVVALDTAPIIYFVEAHPRLGPIVRPLFEERLAAGINLAVTSVVTLAEVLVQPMAVGRSDLVDRFTSLLTSSRHLLSLDISAPVARRAAELRAKHRLRLPDAFQLAVALERGADCFVTNDRKLSVVTDLRVLVLEDHEA
jgi:predicted nucleic acid-binding protein